MEDNLLEISGIYCIRSLVNGKVYVGSAKNIRRRWQQHRSHLRGGRHHSPLLQRSWNKYGEDNFVLEVLEHCTDGIVAREQFWIDRLCSAQVANGFNISPTAGSNSGRKMSIEARGRISAALKGKKRRPMSEEGRRRLSEQRRGRPNPKLRGRKISAAQREKISASLSGRKSTPEEIEARRAGWKAKYTKETPEHIYRAAAARSAKSREEKSEIMRRAWATRRAKKKLADASLPPSPPRTSRYLKWAASIADKRAGWSEKAKARLAALTPEQRTQIALKGHETRRARAI